MYEPCPHGCNHAASDCHRRDSCCHESEDAFRAAVAAEEKMRQERDVAKAAAGRAALGEYDAKDRMEHVSRVAEELFVAIEAYVKERPTIGISAAEGQLRQVYALGRRWEKSWITSYEQSYLMLHNRLRDTVKQVADLVDRAQKAAALAAALAAARAALAAAQARIKKLEEELLGPKCEDVACPDYDGEHPHHATAYIKGDDAGQQKQYGRDQQKIAVLQASAERLEIEKAQLAKFKAYVHERLDQDGVPVDPPSEHREAGCRVGGRLDWVFAELARAKARALDQSVAAETERMRLAACDVVARSDTPASAAENRNMHSDYRSPACDTVARIVDELMDLRTKFAAIRAMAAARRPSDDPPAPCCGQPTSAHDQTSPTCPKSSVEWNPVTGKVSSARPDLFPDGSTVSETRFGARVDIPASPEQPVTVDQMIDALKYVKKFNHCHRCLCSMCQLINTVLEKNSL